MRKIGSSKSITFSFLASVPKNKNPLDLNDYLPKCLVGCIHKIISKLLAGRLNRVIGNVISLGQIAFVPGCSGEIGWTKAMGKT